MSSKGKRIGNFTWVTPPFIIGIVATVVVLITTGWCWSRSLADSASLPWLVTSLVTVAAIPISICCAYWAASNYIFWVEVGDDLKFATPLGSQSAAWDSVRGVEFETEYKTIPLVVLPLALVVGQSCIAVVTLGNGRVLRGRIDHHDAVIIHDMLSKYPRLDTHFVRALSSPRDTMTTFVDAVMEDDLYYASKFLDLSTFDEQTADTLAESCARKLKDVIDSVWYIDYEEFLTTRNHHLLTFWPQVQTKA